MCSDLNINIYLEYFQQKLPFGGNKLLFNSMEPLRANIHTFKTIEDSGAPVWLS